QKKSATGFIDCLLSLIYRRHFDGEIAETETVQRAVRQNWANPTVSLLALATIVQEAPPQQAEPGLNEVKSESAFEPHDRPRISRLSVGVRFAAMSLD
ncbi:MAG: hypothetical protein ABSB77_05240, partial [Xanthobacteraceae bacterium]